ncbi:uncharacterized protein LOC110991668 isoform X1 [Pieris rapae]|uniref:uncharacterized protein LOC110991668 isoform X1 n=1 Tax=Pieris rapae TaxID=64459 RepID=UPI001E280026|nr:uncharacterized protein LOC110991668 isoform X1 [Pieris rapae]
MSFRIQVSFLLLFGTLLEAGIPKGFILNKATKNAYKLMYQSATWPVARDTCNELGAHLAVPRSQDEFFFIQKLVRGMHYPSINGTDNKLVVWLGINNLEDYTIWRNIYGEDIKKTGFSTWAGDNGEGFSNDPEEPHCGAIDAANPGLRDYWCHRRQPYICQIDLKLNNQ